MPGCRRWTSSWTGRTWRGMRPRPIPSLALATRSCSRWRAPACCPAFSDGTGLGSQVLLCSGASGTVLSRHCCFIKASVGAGGSRHCLSSSSLARPRGCTNSLTLPRVPVAMVRILHVVGVCRRHGWDLGCKHHAAWALHMLCRRVRLSSCLLYSPGEGSGQSVCATALFDGRCQSLGMHRFTASGTGGSLARRSKCYGSLWRAV